MLTDGTRIEWAHYSFNPWTGCTKVSPACDNCYAEGWAKRSGLVKWGPHAARKRTAPANWRKPMAWNAKAEKDGIRRRVFCASLADVFDNHRSIGATWRPDLWHLIETTPALDWLILTKRPQNARTMLPHEWQVAGLPRNVWIGTTVENQAEADRRIPALLEIPAALHFLSCEPLLAPLDLSPWIGVHHHPDNDPTSPHVQALVRAARKMAGPTIDWIIAGGESGGNARPSRPEWFRRLRFQCERAGVPFFFKQWGEWGPDLGAQEDGDRVSEGRARCAWWTGSGWKHEENGYAVPHEALRGHGEWVYRLGKKINGRALDGEILEAIPASPAPKTSKAAR